MTALTEQDAYAIRSIIEAAGEDPETIKLIARLKDENSNELDELRDLPLEEILSALKVTVDELKMLDYLFKDKKRAVQEMEKDGLIAKEHIKKYRKDPNLLYEDTMKGLYFRFVSLAVVGEFL